MDTTKIDSLDRLTNEFSKLPGVGKKTAGRYAYDRIQPPFSIQLIHHCVLWQKHPSPWKCDVQTSKVHSSKDGKQKFCRRDIRHTSEKNHFHLALISRLLYSHDCLLVQVDHVQGATSQWVP